MKRKMPLVDNPVTRLVQFVVSEYLDITGDRETEDSNAAITGG